MKRDIVKGLSVIIFIIAVFIPNKNIAQNYIPGILYVNIKDESAKPFNEPSINTGNSALNTVLNNFNVKAYHKLYPTSKTPALQNTYEIICNCDESLLMNALIALNIFSSVEKVGNGGLISCTNPFTPNEYPYWCCNNYANDMIDAQCAWSITHGDPNINVAVVDIGLESTHEDLRNPWAAKIKQTGAVCGHKLPQQSSLVARTLTG